VQLYRRDSISCNARDPNRGRACANCGQHQLRQPGAVDIDPAPSPMPIIHPAFRVAARLQFPAAATICSRPPRSLEIGSIEYVVPPDTIAVGEESLVKVNTVYSNLAALGQAYAKLGETHKAIECFEQQLRITKEIGDHRGEGIALWNMSLALDQLGKRAQAIECAKAALRIYDDIEDPQAEKTKRKLQEWESQHQNQ
jgi:tetratricopeptide (TPR) repeat protein